MTPAQWQSVKDLFHEALAHSIGERDAWLARACASDGEVAAEVQRLVAAHLAAGSFIETPITDLHDEPRPGRGARSGSWMGPYRLDGLLGVGGMGEVYRATDSSLGRTVAIKMVGHDEAAAHDRLRREARHASALNHPNICTIHHVGDDEGRPFIVMEFVEGRPLADTIPAGGLPTETAVRYAIQVLDALAHAHAHGVVHRDLKSANVMLRPDGQVKLLDFGLARRIETCAAGAVPLSASARDCTTLGGTLPCMAPEMLRGQPVDARTDLWAFGVLLYEMTTGRLPFTGPTGDDVSRAILDGPPAPIPATVPSPLASLILRCLEKNPADRYQGAAEAMPELEAFNAALAAPRAAARPLLGRFGMGLLAASAGMFLVVALLLGGWWWRRETATPPRPIVRALAVLPLANLTGDPSKDYFADGVTEGLITDLGKTGGLRVISRTTAMRYRGATKSLTEVARELKVDALVEGSVSRDGDRVRVSARLFGASDRQLWTGTFERGVGDILALQRDIVHGISGAIGGSPAVQDDARRSLVRAVDPRVYESYLKGRYYWNKRTLESLAMAVEQFRAATAADPTYAPAYVGLADCYNQMGTVMVAQESPARMRPLAVAAAIAALQIDGTLGEAHAALAYTRHYDWQWEAAAREFRRAIELSPNNPLVHVWYANYLASRMRFDEAVAEVDKARQLDPLSLVVQTNVGWTLGYAGRLHEAIAAYREALSLDPNYPQAHSRLARAYAEIGRLDAAIAEEETVARLARRSPRSLVELAAMYAHAGRRAEAKALLRDILAASRTQYIPPFALAQVYASLGDADGTFECLERAYDERSNGMVYLNVERVFDPVRHDPRYEDLLKRVGLVQ